MKIFKVNRLDRSWWEILFWWELRRLLYNGIMAIVGLFSMAICAVNIPFIYALVALFLNLFYTLGWIIELGFINRKTDESIRLNYPRQFFLKYLTFSVLFVFAVAYYFLFGIR